MAVSNPNALLKRLLQEPTENPWLEFKHNNCNPELIGQCVSACANAAMLAEKERAFIVFGVENKTKAKIGTTIRLNELKQGGENFSNWLSRTVEPRLLLELIDFQDDGKDFAILVIAPSYDRPVRFKQVEYIRVGENIKKLTEFPEQERALWLATSRHKFEDAVAATHQSEAQVLEKLDTKAYFELSREGALQNPAEIIRRFISLGFLKDDMEGGYDITNLGAVLFARELKTFSSISSKALRIVKYVGKNKAKAEKETEGHRGYAVGFSGLIKFVENLLPTDEKYIDGVRTLVPTYPLTAVREFIANALIHQDFTISGSGPIIEVYQDRIEAINPGNSLTAIDRIIDERRSRNEKLAGTMRHLGLCEERGGGIDKAIIEIEDMRLPAPQFIPSENSMRVVVFGPKKFSQLSKAEKTWACFCHCVIRWIRHDYMSNTTLRDRFSLDGDDYQAVSAVIADARKANRIKPADPDQGKRNARYIPYWV